MVNDTLLDFDCEGFSDDDDASGPVKRRPSVKVEDQKQSSRDDRRSVSNQNTNAPGAHTDRPPDDGSTNGARGTRDARRDRENGSRGRGGVSPPVHERDQRDRRSGPPPRDARERDRDERSHGRPRDGPVGGSSSTRDREHVFSSGLRDNRMVRQPTKHDWRGHGNSDQPRGGPFQTRSRSMSPPNDGGGDYANRLPLPTPPPQAGRHRERAISTNNARSPPKDASDKGRLAQRQHTTREQSSSRAGMAHHGGNRVDVRGNNENDRQNVKSERLNKHNYDSKYESTTKNSNGTASHSRSSITEAERKQGGRSTDERHSLGTSSSRGGALDAFADKKSSRTQPLCRNASENDVQPRRGSLKNATGSKQQTKESACQPKATSSARPPKSESNAKDAAPVGEPVAKKYKAPKILFNKDEASKPSKNDPLKGTVSVLPERRKSLHVFPAPVKPSLLDRLGPRKSIIESTAPKQQHAQESSVTKKISLTIIPKDIAKRAREDAGERKGPPQKSPKILPIDREKSSALASRDEPILLSWDDLYRKDQDKWCRALESSLGPKEKLDMIRSAKSYEEYIRRHREAIA